MPRRNGRLETTEPRASTKSIAAAPSARAKGACSFTPRGEPRMSHSALSRIRSPKGGVRILALWRFRRVAAAKRPRRNKKKAPPPSPFSPRAFGSHSTSSPAANATSASALASSTSCRANPSTRSRHTWSARPKSNARRSEGQNVKTSAGTSAPSPPRAIHRTRDRITFAEAKSSHASRNTTESRSRSFCFFCLGAPEESVRLFCFAVPPVSESFESSESLASSESLTSLFPRRRGASHACRLRKPGTHLASSARATAAAHARARRGTANDRGSRYATAVFFAVPFASRPASFAARSAHRNGADALFDPNASAGGFGVAYRTTRVVETEKSPNAPIGTSSLRVTVRKSPTRLGDIPGSSLARRRTGHAFAFLRLRVLRAGFFGFLLGAFFSSKTDGAASGTSEPSTTGGPRDSGVRVPGSRPSASNDASDAAAPATTTSTEDTAGRAPTRWSASSPRRVFARHHPTNTSAGSSSPVPALRASSPPTPEIRGRLG
mmetsp:Transcript_7992/g.34012  ORF Transcript_7992/g.34012 Transcript_7992/m.34012 type:complete len:494 (+) Transcript_7992:741-2222(+)